MPFIVLGVVAAIVFVQEGQRRIPIQYAKRVVGRRMTQGGQTYLPLRVNMAGVIPVIFAASVMAIPPTIGQLIGQNRNNFATHLASFFNPQGWHYVLGESLLIIVFTYFYTAVTFNPVDQADNLRKYGGFIPGVRPGRPTAEFLDRILARLTLPGSTVPGGHRRAADHPHQPDQRQLLLRRHLDPDRDRSGPGHDEAARGAADDAQLRGVLKVGRGFGLGWDRNRETGRSRFGARAAHRPGPETATDRRARRLAAIDHAMRVSQIVRRARLPISV